MVVELKAASGMENPYENKRDEESDNDNENDTHSNQEDDNRSIGLQARMEVGPR